jgi:hypothetical protein
MIDWIFFVGWPAVGCFIFIFFHIHAKKDLKQSQAMRCDSIGDPERRAENIVRNTGDVWLSAIGAILMLFLSIWQAVLLFCYPV